MHPPSSPVRRSSRSNKGVTSKFNDYMTGDEQLNPYYVQSMACSSQLPTPAQGLAQSYQHPAYQPYQYQPYLPYNAHCDQYNQQCNPQNMGPVISPAENRVFVSDGFSWNEYNLENVFSG